MSYYYEEEKENLEKEIYERIYQKQLKTTNKVFLLVFGLIGFIFTIIGLILTLLGVEDEGMLVGLPFLIMGGIFLLIGIIVKLTNSKVPDYDKFKKRVDSYGGYYSMDLIVRLAILEEKNKILEQRIEELERRR